MIADLGAVSEWRGFDRAIIALLIRDLALTQSDEIPDRFLDDELLSEAPDETFFEALLEDAKTRYTPINPLAAMAHAEIACRYARRAGWPHWRRFLLHIFDAGEGAGEIAARRAWAREGLEGDGVDPLARALCHETLGRCLADERRYREARVELARAVELAHEAGDSNVEWRAITAIVAACQQQVPPDQLTAADWNEQAESVARTLDDPFFLAKTLTDRANIEYALGQYETAARFHREALAAAERGDLKLWQSNALGNLGNIAMQMGDTRAAEEHGRRALAISIEIGNAESEQHDRHNLAQVLRVLDRPDEAIEMERQALRIARDRNDDKAAHYRDVLRRWYVDMGDLVAARALDDRADVEADDEPPEEVTAAVGSADEDDPDARIDAEVRAAMTSDDFAKAEELARKAVEERGNEWQTWFQLGVVLSQRERDEEAVRAYDAALERNPHATPVLFNQINAMMRLGRIEEVLQRFSAAVEDDPLDPMARAGLGRVHFFRDQFDDSIRSLRESARLRPSPTVRLALAQSLTSKARSLLRDEFDRAWALFEEAVDVFSNLLHDHPRRGELFSYAAMAFQSFAEMSFRVNPPLIGGIAADELIVFGHAVHFYDRALQLLGSGPMLIRNRNYCADIVRSIGNPRELAVAAQRLVESRVPAVALMFLVAAIEREERSGEPHYQLAMLLWHGMEGEPDLQEVKELLEEAVRREPKNEKFVAALRAVDKPKASWHDELKRRLTGDEL